MPTVSKTTNALENLLQIGRDVLKKEEAKIYTDPLFSTCTLLLIPCVVFSKTLGELQPRVSNVSLLVILENVRHLHSLRPCQFGYGLLFLVLNRRKMHLSFSITQSPCLSYQCLCIVYILLIYVRIIPNT